MFSGNKPSGCCCTVMDVISLEKLSQTAEQHWHMQADKPAANACVHSNAQGNNCMRKHMANTYDSAQRTWRLGRVHASLHVPGGQALFACSYWACMLAMRHG